MSKPVIQAAMHTATLVPLTAAHVTQRYVDWLNDPEVNQYLETRFQEWTRDSVQDYVQAAFADPLVFLFAIVVDGKHIGNLKIGPINSAHHFADISYFIGDKAEWSKGYGTDAVRAACIYAFKELKLHRLQAGVYGKNRRSRKVLIASGFAHEGTQRRKFKTDIGWDDHELFGRCSDVVAL